MITFITNLPIRLIWYFRSKTACFFCTSLLFGFSLMLAGFLLLATPASCQDRISSEDSTTPERTTTSDEIEPIEYTGEWLELRQQLRVRNYETRLNAVTSLEGRNEPEAIALLGIALKDMEYEVRNEAVRILGQLDNTEARELLIQALSDYNDYIRRSAAVALGNFPSDRALAPLYNAMYYDESLEVRYRAALSLKKMGMENIGHMLIESMYDPEITIRKKAIELVGELREPYAETELLKTLEDPDPEIRFQSIIALRKYNSPKTFEALLVTMDDADFRVREAAIQGFRTYVTQENLSYSERIMMLSTVLEATQPSNYPNAPIVRSEAVWAMSEVGVGFGNNIRGYASEYIAPRLKDPVPMVRINAVWWVVAEVGNSIPEEEVPTFIENHIAPLLSDSEGVVALTAMEGLGEIGDPAALPLLRPFWDHDILTVRKTALEAISKLRDNEGVYILKLALKNQYEESEEIKLMILKIFAEKDIPDVASDVFPFLNNGSSQVRLAAMEVLRRLQCDRCTGYLIRRLDDWNPEIQIRAIDILMEYADKEELVSTFTFKLSEDSKEVLTHLIRALGQLRMPEAISALQQKLLRVEDVDAQAEIIIVLGLIGGQEAREIVEQYKSSVEAELRRNENSHFPEKIRIAYAGAMVMFGQNQWLEHVQQGMEEQDFEVRLLTYYILGAIHTPVTRQILLDAMDTRRHLDQLKIGEILVTYWDDFTEDDIHQLMEQYRLQHQNQR